MVATKYTFGGIRGDINSRGNGRKNAYRAIEASLRRLNMDYVDLYWMHAWDTVTPVEEIVQTFDALIRAGKIRYYGLSDVPAWLAAQIVGYAHHNGLAAPIALQLEYSLVERVIEREHLPFAARAGLGLCPWSPLGGGLLSGKYKRGEEPVGRLASEEMPQHRRLGVDATWVTLDALHRIATESKRTVAEVAINWVLNSYGSNSVIVGATGVDQLIANLKAGDFELTTEQLKQLNAASRLESVSPYNFFRQPRLGKTTGHVRGFDRSIYD